MPPISDIFTKPIIEEDKEAIPVSPRSKNRFFLFVVIIILLIFPFWGYFKYFPKCNVKIVLKNYPHSFEQKIVAGLDQPLAVQYFSKEDTLKMSFKATGKEMVQNKAQGKILIYNAYSSSPQLLIKGTRFQAKNGLIFRLKKRLIVPGATIEKGKIMPSVIEAEVEADKPGQEYNIGPQEKFTIPGFKGSEKYQAFYGASSLPMKGGFVGEVPSPTKEDIKKAKEETEKKILNNLKSKIFSIFPQDLKYFKESQRFSILKETVENSNQGGFDVNVKGKYEILSFKENDLKKIISQKIGISQDQNLFLSDSNVSYKNINPNFEKKELSFTAFGKFIFKKKVDKNLLLNQIRGKNLEEAKNIISSLSGLNYAKIKIQPFFVKKLPSNIRKIKIEIQ